MMLRPSTGDIIKKGDSPYSLVIAVAKRARDISDEIEENKAVLEEKPVKTAVDEFAERKFKFVPHNQNQNTALQTPAETEETPSETVPEPATNHSSLFQPAPEKPSSLFQPPPAAPIFPFRNNDNI